MIDDATDVLAEAYNAALNEPSVRTMHDAAKYIMLALMAAGASPAPRGQPPAASLAVGPLDQHGRPQFAR